MNMEARGNRHLLVGTVTSAKRDKTVTVSVERKEKHPIYEKSLVKTTTCHAHDEKDECAVGDIVELMACRPLSKTKHWRVTKVVTKALTI